MTRLALTSLLVAISASASPEPLLKISWKDRAEQQRLASGEVVPGENGRDALRLANEEPQPRQFALADLEPPTIEARTYVVRGRVKYSGVEGDGHLEMWSHFAKGGAYFTKTLATAGGPMGVIRGSSDWRDFILPFDKGDEPSPSRLVINLVLPGRGIVEVSDLELHAPAGDVLPPQMQALGWWPESTAALIGAVGGSLLGVFLGCVIAPLIASGRARHFVYVALGAVGGIGVLTLAMGLSAVAVGQPYHVWYPPVLLGGMGTFFGWGGFAMALRRYRQFDLRKMSALDVA